MKAAGLVFAVRRVEADYLSPARYDDQIEVRTRLAALKGASFEMAQEVWRDETCLFRAQVVIVVLTEQGRATRLPAELRARVAQLAADAGQ